MQEVFPSEFTVGPCCIWYMEGGKAQEKSWRTLRKPITRGSNNKSHTDFSPFDRVNPHPIFPSREGNGARGSEENIQGEFTVGDEKIGEESPTKEGIKESAIG